ncbi:hypothetical protein EDB84DRAFT_1606776 [Lactarius hengduanensis]|nr:hypothetical protein EDB84DRAFT_1606776 [Lactarius hengduanensis]
MVVVSAWLLSAHGCCWRMVVVFNFIALVAGLAPKKVADILSKSIDEPSVSPSASPPFACSPVRGNLGGVVRVYAWPTLHTNWSARKWVKGGAALPFPHRHSFARTRFRGCTRPPPPGRVYTPSPQRTTGRSRVVPAQGWEGGSRTGCAWKRGRRKGGASRAVPRKRGWGAKGMERAPSRSRTNRDRGAKGGGGLVQCGPSYSWVSWVNRSGGEGGGDGAGKGRRKGGLRGAR